MTARGPNCLCNTHHEMYKKKQLKLSKKEYPELFAPIDLEKNTELDYFSELGSEDSVQQMLLRKRINLDIRHPF